MRKSLLLAAALAAVPSLAVAGPLDGRWAGSIDDCMAQYADTAIQVDTAAGYILYWEARCEFTSLVPVGQFDRLWQVNLSCSGEGDQWTYQGYLGVTEPYDGSPVQLVEIITGAGGPAEPGWVTTWVRCSTTRVVK